jgi:hypothetical protein
VISRDEYDKKVSEIKARRKKSGKGPAVVIKRRASKVMVKKAVMR